MYRSNRKKSKMGCKCNSSTGSGKVLFMGGKKRRSRRQKKTNRLQTRKVKKRRGRKGKKSYKYKQKVMNGGASFLGDLPTNPLYAVNTSTGMPYVSNSVTSQLADQSHRNYLV